MLWLCCLYSGPVYDHLVLSLVSLFVRGLSLVSLFVRGEPPVDLNGFHSMLAVTSAHSGLSRTVGSVRA